MGDSETVSAAERSAVERHSPTELQTIARTWRLADQERWSGVVVIVLGVASSLLEGVSLALLILLFQLLTGQEPAQPLPVVENWAAWGCPEATDSRLVVLGTIIGLFVASALVGYASLAFSSRLAMRFAHRLRGKLISFVLKQPLWQVEAFGSGAVANSILSESWRACDALFAVLTAITQAFACVVFITILMGISVEYTLYLLAMTIFSAAVIQLATSRLKQLSTSALTANELYTKRVLELVQGLRDVRAHGYEVFEAGRFEHDGNALTSIFIKMALLGGVVAPLSRVLFILVGGTLVTLTFISGDDLAMIFGFLAVAYRMQPRVNGIIGERAKLASVSASVAALDRSLAMGDGQQQREACSFVGMVQGIQLDNVWAAYPGAETSALCGVSCHIIKGKMTVIAGHSGAGKSTLVGLLLGFGRPHTGQVLVDGTPLSALDPTDWHERVAFVSQDPMIFSATVRENIAYGNPHSEMAVIEAAARDAQAHDFIMQLANGYHTVVGDQGIRLSSGQRQRLALARAFLRNPEILILDEATNALDEPTEQAIRGAIDRWRQTRLVIVIAHRASTIRGADHVVVLAHGTLVDEGTPQALAVRCPTYNELYRDLSLLAVEQCASPHHTTSSS